MRRNRASIRWVMEFVILGAVWFVFAASLSPSDILTGIFAAALGASAVEAVRATGMRFLLPRSASFLLGVWAVALEAVRDCWALLVTLAQRPFGTAPLRGLVVTDFEAGDPDDATRRALAVSLTTITPNSIAIEIDRDENLMLLHQIKPAAAPYIVKRMRRA